MGTLCLRFMASSFAVCYFVLNFFRLHWQMYHGANITLTPFLLYPPWILYLIFEEAAKPATHLSNSSCIDKFLMLNITLKLYEVMPLVFDFESLLHLALEKSSLDHNAFLVHHHQFVDLYGC